MPEQNKSTLHMPNDKPAVSASATISFSETPEFREAVSRELAAVLPQILSELKQPSSSGGMAQGVDHWNRELAMAIAEITTQNSGRTYVAPDVLKQRNDARKRMVDLITKAREEKRPATYKITSKVQLCDQIIDPFWVDNTKVVRPTEIDWNYIPNDAMVPVNETAREIFEAFKDSTGSLKKVVPDDQLGMTPNGLVIKNGAVSAAQRNAINFDTDDITDRRHDGLVIHNKNAPGRYVEKNILGTLHSPAKEAV